MVGLMRIQNMTRKFALMCLLAAVPLTGCNKIKSLPFLEKKKPVEAAAPEAPKAAATPAPAAKPEEQATEATPAKSQPNSKASVIVLCYHRFEDRPKDALAINPVEFEQQLVALKENGFAVIPMKDFLAWRRGEKEIPEKSCIISIDDGYRSGYEVAWPILKKHGYPFTMFIYTNYIKGQPNAGGQSMSWDELGEMRDAGVDIESHTVSHMDLRVKKGKSPEQYEQWLRNELAGSRKLIEQQLGISVKCLAYPYGNHNADVRRIANESGYEASFSVYGQRLTYNSPADHLGRYAIEGGKPLIFQSAIKMIGGGAGADAGESTIGQLAAASMVTQPMEGETVTDPRPTLKANLATFGNIDPGSVEIRLSGVGPIPVKFDPVSKIAEAKVPQDLREPSYTVILSAKVSGRKMETRWTFNYKGPGAVPAAPATPATEAVPAKPATKPKNLSE